MTSMWMQVSVSGRAVFTRYPSPLAAGAYGHTAVTGGLTQQQVRSREAHHEAGHAAIGMAMGLPVTGVHLFDRPASVPGAPTGTGREMEHSGHTAVGPWDGEVDVRHVLVFLAAGVRAAHRWLEEQGLDNPHSVFFNDVVGGVGDQERMTTLKTTRPILFTWGAERPPAVPPGHDHIEMASLYTQADGLVRACWPHITAIAHHLLTYASADASNLRSLHPETLQPQD